MLPAANTITAIDALEILDSRNPTVRVTVKADGTRAQASVPSGASTAKTRRSSCVMAIAIGMVARVPRRS